MTIILGILLLPITQKKCVIPAERSECRNLKTQMPVLVSKRKTKPARQNKIVMPNGIRIDVAPLHLYHVSTEVYNTKTITALAHLKIKSYISNSIK
jgi:hypothetical protein